VERGKLDPDVTIDSVRSDMIVAEAPVGISAITRIQDADRARTPRALPEHVDNQLVLYVITLFGVTNTQGELISGDALLVRPKGTSAKALLSTILECPISRLPDLLARSGTWSVRELHEIDGHRVRFDP
jgi:hypothetical protein